MRRHLAPLAFLVALILTGAVGAGCQPSTRKPRAAEAPRLTSQPTAPATPAGTAGPAGTTTPAGTAGPLPGMPALLDPADVYAADRPGRLSPQVRGDRALVYVPNFASNTVSVIEPRTARVIRTVRVGRGPQHVVPSWDLRTLWVNNNSGDSLTPIDPRTGAFGKPIRVDDPYNLYFTPDGRYAVVMAERRREITFRDPHTMAVRHVLRVGCDGVNHADFSTDGRYFIVTCEYSGDLLKIDTTGQRIVKRLHLPGEHPMPQDIKISPDGRTWYVADMSTGGVWTLDGDAFSAPSFLRTGDGAHGLYVSRDSRYLYVSNRGEGTISVLAFATGRPVHKWRIPGHASPDMGGVSADGRALWLSGRYDREVYSISTIDGHLITRIRVGTEPHGLCVWPQPGRYSLGHTGILR
jgi:YVTN family beta-propeller protein